MARAGPFLLRGRITHFPLDNPPPPGNVSPIDWTGRILGAAAMAAGGVLKGAFRVDKYWAPVNRVENAYGDRNLVCTCPPLEDYAEAAE